jgi:von Willebrand factor type D domain
LVISIARLPRKDLVVRQLAVPLKSRCSAGFALLCIVLAVAATTVGLGTFSPGVAAAKTPTEQCAANAIGTVTPGLKSAVCTELMTDLAGIGNLLALPVLDGTGSLTSPVQLIFSDDPAPDPDEEMETKYFPSRFAQSVVEPCQITIYPGIYSAESPTGSPVSAPFAVVLAHEVVHCYQNSVISFAEAGGNDGTVVPGWISEGVATYIATLYKMGGEPGTPKFWANGWLGTTNKELEGRTYDAVGWYSLVAHVTGDNLTSKIAPAWRAFIEGGEKAFIGALGGNDPAVAMAWGPSLVHIPDWGDVWGTPGIGVPYGAQPSTTYDTLQSEDVPYQIQIVPLGGIVDIESGVSDGLVHINVNSGFASIHDADGDDYLDFKDELFCVKESCPDASATCPGRPDQQRLQPLAAPFTVAVAGSSTPATLTMENMSEPTKPPNLPKTEGPCDGPGALPPSPAGYSEGEPHIQTLDGGNYDFQGAGEYTLVRSDSGDVDVQVRATPFEGSASVAFNTAVAMRVVSTKVEVDAGDPSILLINGKRITGPLSNPRKLTGGGQVQETDNGSSQDFDVTWPDGSELDVVASALGENDTFVPPTPGLDHFSGLLTAVTKAKQAGPQVYLAGDGKQYTIDPTTRSGFKTLYGPFADSWRVTKQTSLFTYAKGKSTSSYVKQGFPARLVSASLLSPDKRRQAKATCQAAGVSGTTLLDDCEVDVGETGNKHFAAATAGVQTGNSPTPQPTTSTSAPAPPTPAGSVHPASYYFTHPCAAVSLAEIVQVAGPTDSLAASGSATCTFRPNSSSEVEDIAFSHQSAKLFESTTPGKAGSGPVTSLGGDAYCIVDPSFTDQSYVVDDLGSAGSIQVLAASCTQGTALVKDALERISGS